MKLLAVVVCFSVVLMSRVCDARPKNHVSVTNEITGSPIDVHCFSGDDDLGNKQLAYEQQVSWVFASNIWGTTKYICTISTAFGKGSYTVYTDKIMTDRCGDDCNWKVQQNGPCLDQSKDNEAPWCFAWE